MMKKIILILILVILLGTQFFLPSYTAEQIANSIKAEVDNYQTVDVKVKSVPALKLLLKSADEVQVQGQNIVIDRLQLASLQAHFKNLKVQEEQERQVIAGENTKLYILLREKALNDYLRTKEELDIFNRIKVDITPQQVILNGAISILDAEVNLQLTGDFVVVKDKKIVFQSDKLAVENFLISTSSIEQLKDKLQFELDLRELPLPLDVRQVKLKSDELEIIGPSSENN